MIVRETVSHVPHVSVVPPELLPQPVLQPPTELQPLHEPTPHGLQLAAQGAEQQRLTRWRQ